jgi:site-specific DNA-methyltransferase (adenine-specific)
MTFIVHHGDCREVMATLDAESVDAIVSDPPYGLSFMGKGWDHGVPGVEFWTEALRVAKPGAHLLAFGGTRTYHRLACAIEDAGWEIRDCVMWVYGSGFPKSHDVSKAIDKAAGAEREVVGVHRHAHLNKYRSQAATYGTPTNNTEETAPATDAARQWSGWGTALKPAWEPIIVARKPPVGTVAENVLTHGTGGINVDG